MEIVDYLEVARRRLWIILVIPLLAGAGVLGHWQLSAKDYQATAYVFAPDLLTGTGNQFSGPAGIASWVNEFSATAVSPRVTRRLAAETGVRASDISHGLEVTQLQQSGQLQVTFSWKDPTVADKVVQGAATATPKALFAPQLAQARHAVNQSRDSLRAVYEDLLQGAMTWGHSRPDLVYVGRLRALADLERARVDLKAGDVAAMAVADIRIARVKAQLAALQHNVVEFENLNAQRKATTTVLARAQADLQSARAQYAGASGAVTVLPVQPTRLASVLLKGVLAAVIAGLFIAFCLVAALEFLHVRREAPPAPIPAPANDGRSSVEPPTHPASNGRKQKSARPKALGPTVVDVTARGDR